MDDHTIALACLTWSSPRTLASSMASWRSLTSPSFTERHVWIQALEQESVDVATAHGWTVHGTDDNSGIGFAYLKLLEATEATHFLFLEDDWILTARNAAAHIENAVRLIEAGRADVVRLRSTRKPGWPVNPIQFQNRELEYPRWLLEAVLWEPELESIFPAQIDCVDFADEKWRVARSEFASWTNNPHIARTEFLMEHVAPRCAAAGNDLEGTIAASWESADITVAHGRGLFTHRRTDGPSFRSRPLWKRVGYPLRNKARRLLRSASSREAE